MVLERWNLVCLMGVEVVVKTRVIVLWRYLKYLRRSLQLLLEQYYLMKYTFVYCNAPGFTSALTFTMMKATVITSIYGTIIFMWGLNDSTLQNAKVLSYISSLFITAGSFYINLSSSIHFLSACISSGRLDTPQNPDIYHILSDMLSPYLH